MEKLLEKGVVDSKTFNQLEKVVEVNGANKMGRRMSSSSDSDYIFESEDNNDSKSADKSSYEKPTICQLLLLYDVAFIK